MYRRVTGLRLLGLLAVALQAGVAPYVAAEILELPPARDSVTDEARQASPLSQRWELEPSTKRGLWVFQPHQPTYFLLGRYSDSVNQSPYDVFFDNVDTPNLGLDETEAKFQFSFKIKAFEGFLSDKADLWFGYTQQNHWQLYNNDISAPFRETNYSPEAFVTFPVRYDVLGLQGRFINLGILHQSNGQGNLLSRSWNRVYAQFGFERGEHFTLLFKPWYRIPEDENKDDNPDITDYIGDFETVATWKTRQHSFSVLGRSGFEFERGYLQLDWTFPLQQNLKGYVQATTGYGESMIDYNHSQNTIGIGLLLIDWM